MNKKLGQEPEYHLDGKFASMAYKYANARLKKEHTFSEVPNVKMPSKKYRVWCMVGYFVGLAAFILILKYCA